MLDCNLKHQDVSVGQRCYLMAAENVFDGLTGRTFSQPETGPLWIDRVYRCGNHIRISAHGDGLAKVDAAMSAFRVMAD